MALSMQDSGKYLSKKWHERRAKYKIDPEGFGDDEKEWIEASNIQGAGDRKKESWLVETQPIDVGYYESKGPNMVDLRDIKRVHQGDKEEE